MFETAGATFFAAVAKAAETHLGRDHACCAAIERAVRSGEAGDAALAQQALHDLDPAVLATIMADAHRTLATDPAAILAAMQAHPGATRH